MIRALRIALLAGGIAAFAGLTLWWSSGAEQALPDPPTPVTSLPGGPARMVGTSAIGHDGPAAPPVAGPAAAVPVPIVKERKGAE
nr:hypothetical protein [Nitrospirota bacterium]